MKKFRIAWLVFTAVVFLVFVCYRIGEIRREDSSGPEIRFEEEQLTVSVKDDESVLLEGMTATDRKDGDVTDSLIVETLSNFYGDGKRLVTYAAFDSDRHVTRIRREITYRDYTSPRFELTRSLRYRVGEVIDLTGIVKVTDCIDGDISDKVRVQLDSAINNRTPGVYRIEYQVTNSTGDTVYLPAEVEVYQSATGEVKIELKKYLFYCDGEEPDYETFVKQVTLGGKALTFEEGEEEGKIRIDSRVDTGEPGVYPVYFTYESDRYQGTEVLLVVVE